MATNAELVAQVYVGFYDRAPDPVGLQYWVGRLEAGVSIQDIGDSFAASPKLPLPIPSSSFPTC
jgi:S-layer protein